MIYGKNLLQLNMNEQPNQTSSGQNLISTRKRAIRRRFLERFIAFLLPLVFIALPISLSRIPQTGLHPNHISHVLGSLLVLYLFFVRRRLSDRWIIIYILFLASAVSVSAFIQYGLVSAGFYFATAAIFVTSVAVGLRAGIICTFLYGIVMSVIAYLWISGYLVFPGDANKYILLPSVWVTLGVAFLMITSILVVSASGFFTGLTELVDTIDVQKRKIEKRTAELTQANQELEEAMKDIKTLSGLLPICSNCKNIRDDQGYWQQVEHYVQGHSQATFTHSLCPDCIRKLYPEIAERVLQRMEED